MGKPKTAKSKKKKFKDFIKKRVKVGKRLPKADNYTDTSFKTQTIEVLQHIRTKDSSLPTTKRNLSIKDLLTQCQHYNGSIRKDGVKGLQELLKAHPALLTDNLSSILQKTAELFTDNTPSVRQANLGLLRTVLPMVCEKALNPFFPQLSAHLCCAMTHIDENRKRDSLFIFDQLLKHFPKQVIRNSGQLLPNFIHQISLLRQSGSEKGSDMVRTLSMNPDSKLSLIKWRLNVMQRLSKILSVIIEEEGSHVQLVNLRHGKMHPTEQANGCSNTNGMTIIEWSDYEQDQQVVLRLNDAYQQKKKNNNTRNFQVLENKRQVQNFVEMLVPLVLECWVECSPEAQTSGTRIQMSPAFLPIMASMAELLKLVCQYIDLTVKAGNLKMRGWFSQMYGVTLVNRLMVAFPYSTYTSGECQTDQKMIKPFKTAKVPKWQTSAYLEKELNLDICNILSYLTKDNCDAQLLKVQKTRPVCIAYLKMLLNQHRVRQKLLRSIVQIIEQFLSVEGQHDDLSPVIEAMLKTYNCANPFSTEKIILVQFFLHLMEKQRNFSLHDVYDRFLSTLPNLLVEMVTSGCKSGSVSRKEVQPILWAIKQASCQKTTSLLTHLQAELVNIFKLVPMVEPSLQHDILEIMYRLDHFTAEQMNKFIYLSRNSEVAVEKIGFVLEILQHRLTRSEATTEEIDQYFSLLFSIALGKSQKILSILPGQCEPDLTCTSGPTVMFSAEPDTDSRHCAMVKMITSLLTRWPNTIQMHAIINTFIKDLLGRYSILTEETVLGLISIIHAAEIHTLYIPKVSEFIENLCYYLLQQLKFMRNVTKDMWSCTPLRDELWRIIIAVLKLPSHRVAELLAEGIHSL